MTYGAPPTSVETNECSKSLTGNRTANAKGQKPPWGGSGLQVTTNNKIRLQTAQAKKPNFTLRPLKASGTASTISHPLNASDNHAESQTAYHLSNRLQQPYQHQAVS